ncbi:unnamed protein product [Pedinophyceae sp. YPF-701]|nr:unnamed protein product [Pedinophyceae sp. YPF-701]
MNDDMRVYDNLSVLDFTEKARPSKAASVPDAILADRVRTLRQALGVGSVQSSRDLRKTVLLRSAAEAAATSKARGQDPLDARSTVSSDGDSPRCSEPAMRRTIRLPSTGMTLAIDPSVV